MASRESARCGVVDSVRPGRKGAPSPLNTMRQTSMLCFDEGQAVVSDKRTEPPKASVAHQKRGRHATDNSPCGGNSRR